MVSFLAQTAVEQATGVAPLDNVMALLTQFGFFRVVLPFLLIFALIYAILMKTKVLGDPALHGWVRGTSAVISLAIAFFVIASTPVVTLLMTLVPQASFILVVALFLLMIITFAVPENYLTGTINRKWLIPMVIILIIVFLGIIGAATPDIPFLSGMSQFMMGKIALPELTADAVNTIIAVLVMFAIPLIIVAMVIWGNKKGA